MSDNNNTPEATIAIGGTNVALTAYKFKKSKRVDNPEKPGKKKNVETEVDFVGPVLNSVSAALVVFGALFNEAETRNPGGGEKLAIALLKDRIEAATEAGFDATSGKEDMAAFVNELVNPETSSKAVSETDILRQQVDLGMELAHITPGLMSPDAWKEVLDSNGKPLFANQNALIQRFSALQTDLARLHTLHEAKLKKKEEAAAARKAKALEAAKTVAAAAPAAAPAA